MKYFILIFSILILSSCGKVITDEEGTQYCKNKWQELTYIINMYPFDQTRNDIMCHKPESKYEKCLRIMRNTFSDLSDTWGNNTNNQDSISKTMSAEIDRCLLNIK